MSNSDHKNSSYYAVISRTLNFLTSELQQRGGEFIEQHLEAKSESLATSSWRSVSVASENFPLSLSASLKGQFYVKFYQTYSINMSSAKWQPLQIFCNSSDNKGKQLPLRKFSNCGMIFDASVEDQEVKPMSLLDHESKHTTCC